MGCTIYENWCKMSYWPIHSISRLHQLSRPWDTMYSVLQQFEVAHGGTPESLTKQRHSEAANTTLYSCAMTCRLLADCCNVLLWVPHQGCGSAVARIYCWVFPMTKTNNCRGKTVYQLFGMKKGQHTPFMVWHVKKCSYFLILMCSVKFWENLELHLWKDVFSQWLRWPALIITHGYTEVGWRAFYAWVHFMSLKGSEKLEPHNKHLVDSCGGRVCICSLQFVNGLGKKTQNTMEHHLEMRDFRLIFDSHSVTGFFVFVPMYFSVVHHRKCSLGIRSVPFPILCVVFFILKVVGGIPTPLKNMSQLGWWHSQYMEKHIPNHQPGRSGFYTSFE